MLSRVARGMIVAVVFLLAAPSGQLELVTTAAAKRSKRSKRKPTKPIPPAPAVAPASSPAVAPAPTTELKAAAVGGAAHVSSGATEAILNEAKRLYESLEYADVIPLAAAVLARENATIEMRLDAYLLQGSSLAIVGNSVDAEKPFRFLLRGRPGYDMSPETPPKILAVFRKVQVEERAIVTQMAELKRARIISELKLEGDTPESVDGGLPLEFEYRLRDPGRAVDRMSVHYRRNTGEPFSALALQIDDSGSWRAQIPGEWTENDDGFMLEYYVTTTDAEGRSLLSAGEAGSPLNIMVAPGTVADARPIYKSPWLWAAAGGLAIVLSVGGYFLYAQATELPETDGRIDL